jgi:hypothetical protein
MYISRTQLWPTHDITNMPFASPTCLVEGCGCHQQHCHVDQQRQAQRSSNVQEVVQAQLTQAGAGRATRLPRN